MRKFVRSQSTRNGATGSSFRSSFEEEAWKRYNRRMQEEYEEEMERVVSFSLLASLNSIFLIRFFFLLSLLVGCGKGRVGLSCILRLQTLFGTPNYHHVIVGIRGLLDQ